MMEEFLLKVSLIIRVAEVVGTEAVGLEVLGKGFATLDDLPPLPRNSLVFRELEEFNTRVTTISLTGPVSARRLRAIRHNKSLKS